MEASDQDTIVAPLTPQSRSAVAIIRISGPLVPFIKQKHFKTDLTPRKAYCLSFYDEKDQVLDEGVVLYFQAPFSFTGEDVLEFQGHGSPLLVDQILQSLQRTPKVRLAKPGEFSERAFLNGKIDLTQAEAIADLIEANSFRQAQAALKSLKGGLSRHVQIIEEKILEVRTPIEAYLDFVEEELSEARQASFQVETNAILGELEQLIQKSQTSQRLSSNFSIGLIGAPNSGKSSLFNQLIGEERAIVSDVAGTTRDVVSESLFYQGASLKFLDTAGIRSETTDFIEQEGISRSKKQIETAHLLLWVIDAQALASMQGNLEAILTQKEEELYSGGFSNPYFVVLNKSDLLSSEERRKLPTKNFPAPCQGFHLCSAKNGEGLAALKEKIGNWLKQQTASEDEELFLARLRHLSLMKSAQAALAEGNHAFMVEGVYALDRLATSLKQAQDYLGAITGRVYDQAMIDGIFSKFCLGK